MTAFVDPIKGHERLECCGKRTCNFLGESKESRHSRGYFGAAGMSILRIAGFYCNAVFVNFNAYITSLVTGLDSNLNHLSLVSSALILFR